MNPKNTNPEYSLPSVDSPEQESPIGDALENVLALEQDIDTHTENINTAYQKMTEGEISQREYRQIVENQAQLRSLQEMGRDRQLNRVEREVNRQTSVEAGVERRLTVPDRIGLAKVALASALNRLS